MRIVARQKDVLAALRLFLSLENEKKKPKLLTGPEFDGILAGFACKKRGYLPNQSAASGSRCG
jgi:hypothetical protein